MCYLQHVFIFNRLGEDVASVNLLSKFLVNIVLNNYQANWRMENAYFFACDLNKTCCTKRLRVK